MEISLAKPLNDKRKQAQVKREQRKQYDQPFDSRGGFRDNLQRRNSNGQKSGGFGNYSQRTSGGMNRSDDPFSKSDLIRYSFVNLFLDVNPFGAFAGDGSINGGSLRGGFSGNRGGGSNFNQSNHGGFNNNFRRGYSEPSQNVRK
jgi:hypothetical protein